MIPYYIDMPTVLCYMFDTLAHLMTLCAQALCNTLRVLVAARADLNRPGADGCTSLDLAMALGNSTAIALLSTAGARARRPVLAASRALHSCGGLPSLNMLHSTPHATSVSPHATAASLLTHHWSLVTGHWSLVTSHLTPRLTSSLLFHHVPTAVFSSPLLTPHLTPHHASSLLCYHIPTAVFSPPLLTITRPLMSLAL